MSGVTQVPIRLNAVIKFTIGLLIVGLVILLYNYASRPLPKALAQTSQDCTLDCAPLQESQPAGVPDCDKQKANSAACPQDHNFQSSAPPQVLGESTFAGK